LIDLLAINRLVLTSQASADQAEHGKDGRRRWGDARKRRPV